VCVATPTAGSLPALGPLAEEGLGLALTCLLLLLLLKLFESLEALVHLEVGSGGTGTPADSTSELDATAVEKLADGWAAKLVDRV